MRAIKEFLKPNGWKIGTALFCGFVVVLGIVGGEIYRQLQILVGIVWVPTFPLVLIISPLISSGVFYWEGHKATSWELLRWFVAASIYWYLLSCLIYLILRKIKGVFQKKSPQTTL
ncbi:hypothetical protein A2W45_02360 [Candidatus Curtissbacteria bacterium RIFCSPHIGHO2_12_41_11]|uniref:Uncharacterized protein n=2 Tax=Candidatus Curtissiibacteriota TaxID=1752717 RepID=A0A1F5HQT2_9BACT|nr:MAG: hypothetical protein A2Z54_03505 [Candidatus Curtissbacteria bacterium RIFCSPHIGHO2_02_39_8]OGD99931.1 MAG: hypothetical protein A2W45_02360 [Candidatus Curtissbacteria bacterium RIFCSPHIGHO2_12_41_11]OGE06568.1 MAG: hypothetical protein A2W70_03850 [Candidatus Curtissbacteria bacterium RIFCSPLOWO2_02_41_11]